MYTHFNQKETALFLADGADGYAIGQQAEVSEIGSLTPDDLFLKLNELNQKADNAEALYGTMPDNTTPEIGTAPRRPVPTT